jgi:hypothetical protein
MEKYHLENLGIKCEGNIKMDFWEVGRDGVVWLRTGQVSCCCEHGKAVSGIVKTGNLVSS